MSLTRDQAVEIWHSRWLKIPVKMLIARYGVDPRRLYEIWEEQEHPGSRIEAFEAFKNKYPLSAPADCPAPHIPTRQVVTRHDPSQLGLFD